MAEHTLECSVLLRPTRWVQVLVEYFWTGPTCFNGLRRLLDVHGCFFIRRSGCTRDAVCSYAGSLRLKGELPVLQWHRSVTANLCCTQGQFEMLKFCPGCEPNVYNKTVFQQGWVKRFPQTLSHLTIQFFVTSTVSSTE